MPHLVVAFYQKIVLTEREDYSLLTEKLLMYFYLFERGRTTGGKVPWPYGGAELHTSWFADWSRLCKNLVHFIFLLFLSPKICGYETWTYWYTHPSLEYTQKLTQTRARQLSCMWKCTVTIMWSSTVQYHVWNPKAVSDTFSFPPILLPQQWLHDPTSAPLHHMSFWISGTLLLEGQGYVLQKPTLVMVSNVPVKAHHTRVCTWTRICELRSYLLRRCLNGPCQCCEQAGVLCFHNLKHFSTPYVRHCTMLWFLPLLGYQPCTWVASIVIQRCH